MQGEQKRTIVKVGEPIVLLGSVSVELKSMTIEKNRVLELVFDVQNVSFPGSISFGANTRIMRDAEGLQYEQQTIADWGSGGKRLLKGTKLKSTAKISLKDRNRSGHDITPIVIAAALRLSFYHQESLINPNRRNILQQNIPVAILEIDKDELRKVVGKYQPKPLPEPERTDIPTLSLNMEKFNRLKFGMKYEEVVLVLGEEGVNNQSMSRVSSTGDSFKMKSYMWQSSKFGSINCSFGDGKLSHKRYINTTRREYKPADLTVGKYDRLETGMTYKQVMKLIGSNGLLLTSSATATGVTERFSWRGEKGNISVLFRDGALSSKRRNGFN